MLLLQKQPGCCPLLPHQMIQACFAGQGAKQKENRVLLWFCFKPNDLTPLFQRTMQSWIASDGASRKVWAHQWLQSINSRNRNSDKHQKLEKCIRFRIIAMMTFWKENRLHRFQKIFSKVLKNLLIFQQTANNNCMPCQIQSFCAMSNSGISKKNLS